MTSGGLLEVDPPSSFFPPLFFPFWRFRHFPKWILTTDPCTKKALKSIDLDELSSSRYISSTDSITKKSYRHLKLVANPFFFLPLNYALRVDLEKVDCKRRLSKTGGV